jgi:hypothetical protein
VRKPFSFHLFPTLPTERLLHPFCIKIGKSIGLFGTKFWDLRRIATKIEARSSTASLFRTHRYMGETSISRVSNKALRTMFGTKRDDDRPCNEELCGLYRSPSIVRRIEYRSLRRDVYKVFLTDFSFSFQSCNNYELFGYGPLFETSILLRNCLLFANMSSFRIAFAFYIHRKTQKTNMS